MLKLDALNQLKQLKTDIKASRNLHKGKVKGTGQKFGFVTLDEGRDVFLPPDEMSRVLPGDRVEVEVVKDDKNKTFAKLERLIESANKFFFGRYTVKGKAHFIEADIPGSPRWIFVPPPKRGKNQAGDLVKGKLIQHPFKSGKGQAVVLEKLGRGEDVGIEWKYSLAKYDVADSWSQAAQSELALLNQASIAKLAESREDLSALPFVTIDGESTQDMDDAIYVESKTSGWNLFVAISDPSALLSESPALESEALERATSVYTPGQQVPMLPKQLSSDLASLVADKQRLAIVLKMPVDAEGNLGDATITLAHVRISHKLSYASVSDALLATAYDDAVLQSLVENLKACAVALKTARTANALVHETKQEFYLELNDQRKVQAIKLRTQTLANALVEECMVAANRNVARLLSEQLTNSDCESIFVTHAGLRVDRQPQIQKVIESLAPDLADKDVNKLEDFVAIMKASKGNTENQELANILTRQFSRSEFASQAKPHMAMGLDAYTTFTSPLRKANDYLVHKQVSAFLRGRPSESITKSQRLKLEERQQDARTAAFEIEQWLKCEFLEKSKNNYTATVMRTFAGGLQLRLNENGVEGALNARELEGKYSYNMELMILSGPAGTFKLEDQVNVSIKGVDWNRKQVQFGLID
jgi:ribonuclease R